MKIRVVNFHEVQLNLLSESMKLKRSFSNKRKEQKFIIVEKLSD